MTIQVWRRECLPTRERRNNQCRDDWSTRSVHLGVKCVSERVKTVAIVKYGYEETNRCVSFSYDGELLALEIEENTEEIQEQSSVRYLRIKRKKKDSREEQIGEASSINQNERQVNLFQEILELGFSDNNRMTVFSRSSSSRISKFGGKEEFDACFLGCFGKVHLRGTCSRSDSRDDYVHSLESGNEGLDRLVIDFVRGSSCDGGRGVSGQNDDPLVEKDEVLDDRFTNTGSTGDSESLIGTHC